MENDEKTGPEARKIPQPTFVTRRDERTLLTVADYIKYMIDPSTGLVTLIFYQIHPTPEQSPKGWTVNEVVHESLLEVKVPFNTMAITAMGLTQTFATLKDLPPGIIVFGPDRIVPKDKVEQNLPK